MANDLNQCNFIGRLGKDPESRFAPSGDQVVGFSLAVGSQWKDKQTSEKKESTEWVNCSVFGKLAGICAEYLHKGDQVFISGRLKTDKWTDKAGVERYMTKVVVEQMQMLGSKSGGESRQSAPQSKPEKKYEGGAAAGNFDDMDDDIPFVVNALYGSADCVSKAYLRARKAR